MSALASTALATTALLPVALGSLLSKGSRGADVGAPDPQTLGRSLAAAYPPAAPPPEPLPLRSPVGLVGVDAEGLLLHIGEGPPEFRRVQWSGLRHVLPVHRGEVTIYVARVGPLVASGLLGAAILRARGPAPL